MCHAAKTEIRPQLIASEITAGTVVRGAVVFAEHAGHKKQCPGQQVTHC